MKYYSDITNQKYDTVAALEADEKFFAEKKREHEEFLQRKAEEEKRSKEVRKTKEDEICNLAKEIANNKRVLKDKIDAYIKEYDAFVLPENIKKDKVAVNEIMSSYHLFPLSPFFKLFD